MTNPVKRIGFVGVGHMGAPMAACLHRAGYDLVLMDMHTQAAADLAAELGDGVQAAGVDPELAKQCDLIITMLPTSAIVAKVLLGPGGLLGALRQGAWIVDMTSGVPDQTQALAREAGRAGVHFLDAPVSGGVARARTGDLAIMVGGPAEQFEVLSPVLSAMGNKVSHVGDVGAGHAMKALNNLVSAGGLLVTVEALLIGSQFGLDPGVMVDILNASSGMNNSTQKKCRQYILSRSFDSGFGLDLMVKDLGIALGVAHAQDVPVPFSSLCNELWASASKLLGPGQDHTAISRLVETLAGAELPPPAR